MFLSVSSYDYILGTVVPTAPKQPPEVLYKKMCS